MAFVYMIYPGWIALNELAIRKKSKLPSVGLNLKKSYGY